MLHVRCSCGACDEWALIELQARTAADATSGGRAAQRCLALLTHAAG
jgi:hypothetical protein